MFPLQSLLAKHRPNERLHPSCDTQSIDEFLTQRIRSSSKSQHLKGIPSRHGIKLWSEWQCYRKLSSADVISKITQIGLLFNFIFCAGEKGSCCSSGR